ncbi:mitochondrial carrier domain-containing protein [Melampsora americana]|nr:mitochondrial carrier domain-containing protein [Melampsora americana]
MNQNKQLNLPSISLHLLSGATSGFASCVLLQPLDLIKTRIQQGEFNLINSSTRSNLVFSLTSRVIKEDGFIGLWRGMTPTIARNVPGVALYFLSLTELRKLMTTLPQFSTSTSTSSSHLSNSKITILPKLSVTGDLTAGIIARTSVGFLLMPITSNLYSYRSIRSAFFDILQQNGVNGLWKGFIPTMIRDAPFAGLFVSTYEKSKSSLQSDSIPIWISSNSILIHLISASFAATLSTLITTPFDFIKTQQQLNPTRFPHFLPTIQSIFNGKLQNFKFFFRGSSLRLIRKGLSSAIGWSIYEGLIRRWATQNS